MPGLLDTQMIQAKLALPCTFRFLSARTLVEESEVCRRILRQTLNPIRPRMPHGHISFFHLFPYEIAGFRFYPLLPGQEFLCFPSRLPIVWYPASFSGEIYCKTLMHLLLYRDVEDPQALQLEVFTRIPDSVGLGGQRNTIPRQWGGGGMLKTE